jgi:hypothetical protein
LIDEHENRISLEREACSEKKKISQVSAENENSGALLKGGVEILLPDNRNLMSYLFIG